MSAHYKRSITMDGAKDAQFSLRTLVRDNLTLAAQTYEASTTIDTELPTAMGAPLTLSLGTVATAAVIYIEYTGTLVDIAVTDNNGTSTLSLNYGTNEGIVLLEGVSITQVTVQNTHATVAAPFYLAAFGAL